MPRPPELHTSDIGFPANESPPESPAWSASKGKWRALLTEIFPPGVACALAPDRMEACPLYPVEALAMRSASEARRQEFRSGRAAARAALVMLSAGAQAVPMGADRAPRWPKGIVGSISHSRSLCAAVVAPEAVMLGLGLDVEEVSEIESHVARQICTNDDLAQGISLAPDLRRLLPNVVFGAKEAFYKAYYPLTQRFLEFGDVSVILHQDKRCGGAFRVHATRAGMPLSSDLGRFCGRWAAERGMIIAGAALRVSGG